MSKLSQTLSCLPVLLLVFVSTLIISCKEDVAEYPVSQLAESLDTMRSSELEAWVKNNPQDIQALNVLYGRYAMSNDLRALLNHAIPVFHEAEEDGNWMTAVYAGTYIGQAYSILFCPDSMYLYFDRIYDKAVEMDLDFPLLVINNMLGVSNLTYSMNYSEALHYFYEALKYCDESRQKNRLLILWNIVNTYSLRESPSSGQVPSEDGVNQALEIYRYGRDNADDYYEYLGALACASMYYNRKDYDSALVFVERSTELETYKSGINSSDALHANILAALGRDEQAEEYFRRCLSGAVQDWSTLIEAYKSYGDYLSGKGKYAEAIANYLKGVEVTEDNNLYFYGHRLYKALADIYTELGEDSLAVKYMRTHQEIMDSVFNVEKERSFSNLRRSYELQKHRNELQERDIRILKEKRIRTALAMVAAVIIASSAAVIIWQRKQQMMYKRLVKTYDAISSSGQRPVAVASPPPDTPADNKEDRLQEIFRDATQEMELRKAFADSELSIDTLAKKIGTNRAYLSKAVNTYAGTTFTEWVNSYRIPFAVRLLSDISVNIPIKSIAAQAGYNNLQSFYQNFKKETGVPPSRYREEIVKLKKQQQV